MGKSLRNYSYIRNSSNCRRDICWSDLNKFRNYQCMADIVYLGLALILLDKFHNSCALYRSS